MPRVTRATAWTLNFQKGFFLLGGFDALGQLVDLIFQREAVQADTAEAKEKCPQENTRHSAKRNYAEKTPCFTLGFHAAPLLKPHWRSGHFFSTVLHVHTSRNFLKNFRDGPLVPHLQQSAHDKTPQITVRRSTLCDGATRKPLIFALRAL